MHFDHERIPERVVHARGSGAHGYFQVYQSMSKYTKAKFLQDPGQDNPRFRSLLHRCRLPRLSRYCPRCPRLCNTILH